MLYCVSLGMWYTVTDQTAFGSHGFPEHVVAELKEMARMVDVPLELHEDWLFACFICLSKQTCVGLL